MFEHKNSFLGTIISSCEDDDEYVTNGSESSSEENESEDNNSENSADQSMFKVHPTFLSRQCIRNK